MLNFNNQNKRALIFFVKVEKQFNKKKFKNFNTYKLFNKHIEKIVSEAKQSVQFDFVLCSDKSANAASDIFIKQRGKNFGEKFNNAINDTFNLGYDEVIIIGNDSPDISANHIIESFKNTSKSVVLGPSYDGGIYLLGLNFQTFTTDISARWNTHYVIEDLIKYFNTKNIYKLNVLFDIDNENDLKDWFLLCSCNAQIIKSQLNTFYQLKFTANDFFINLSSLEQNLFRIHTQKAPPCFYSL